MRLFGGLDWGEVLSSFVREVTGSDVSPPLPPCSSQGQALPIRGGRWSLFFNLFAWDVNQFDRSSLTPPHFIGEGKTMLFSDW